MREVKWSGSHSVVSNSLQPHELYSPWDSPGQNTGVSSLSLLQGIFPTQGSNPGLPCCRQILYPLSHQGSPRILEWGAYPFFRGSSLPRNQTGVSCIAGRFFTSWATRVAQLVLASLHSTWETGRMWHWSWLPSVPPPNPSAGTQPYKARFRPPSCWKGCSRIPLSAFFHCIKSINLILSDCTFAPCGPWLIRPVTANCPYHWPLSWTWHWCCVLTGSGHFFPCSPPKRELYFLSCIFYCWTCRWSLCSLCGFQSSLLLLADTQL